MQVRWSNNRPEVQLYNRSNKDSLEQVAIDDASRALVKARGPGYLENDRKKLELDLPASWQPFLRREV